MANSKESKRSFNTMKEVFDLLNKNNVIYVVLRNYDNLLDDNIYMDGHGDVDLLCEDSEVLARVLKAYPDKNHFKNGEPDKVHYYLYLQNNYMSLDLRHIGDGYYDRKWEKEVLERRVLQEGFYVPHPKDYFYTLIYHAIFQKETLTEEYRARLLKMGAALGIDTLSGRTADFVKIMENHMRENGYSYVFPEDKHVPLKRKYIQDKSLFSFDFKNYLKHLIYDTKIGGIAFLVKIKHRIFGK